MNPSPLTAAPSFFSAFETAELMQAMLDGSLNGILLLEPVFNEEQPVDFLIRSANTSLGQLTGKDPLQAIGKTMEQVFPGYKASGFFDLYRQTWTDNSPRRAEYLYEDAQLKGWFEVSVSRQKTYLVVTVSNTTEAHNAREATQRAVKRLQALIDYSQTGIFVFSPIFNEQGIHVDFRFKTINRMVAALVGQTPEHITGAAASDWFISYRETGLFERYCRTYRTGEAQRFDIHYNVDGLDRWFDVQSVRVDADVLVTFTDFTALKQAQRVGEEQATQTMQQQALLNSVLDSSDSGIIAFEAVRDPINQTITDFRFLLINRAGEQITNSASQVLLGERLSDHFPGNWETGLFDLYAHTTETGQPGRTELYYNHDGLDFWLDISAQKLGDGFVVTFTDISKLKRLQHQLENTITDLQRSNGNLEQFAYVASHDLQEPLRKIQSFGDILQTGYKELLGDEGGDMVNRMQQAASRMSDLIRDLLAYSRLATQSRAGVPVSLEHVLIRVIDDLDLTIRETETVIHTGFLPTITGDELQLRQLVQNLLSNAIKFRLANQQPIIRIEAQHVAASDLPKGIYPLRHADTYYCLSVTDNGIGFEAKYAERIFQVFQRLHGRTQYAGTGIGLAIVQKVVDNHGGAISARSEPGQGAVFSVYLPTA